MEEDTLQIKTKHRIYTFISHLSLHTWEQKYYLQKLHWLGCQRSSQEPTNQLIETQFWAEVLFLTTVFCCKTTILRPALVL